MSGLTGAPPRGKLDLRLLMAGSAVLSVSTLFSSMKPILISSLVEQAGYSTTLAGLAAAMPFIGGVAAPLFLPHLGTGSSNRILRWSSAALPGLELGNALWFAQSMALLLGQFAAGLCGGIILGLVSRLIARSARAGETFGLADAVGVLLMSVMLAAVGNAVNLAGLRGGFLVAAGFCAIFALVLHVGLRGAEESAQDATVARQLGLGYQTASSAIGLILLLSASGCFLGGWIAARFDTRLPLFGAFVLCAAGWHVALHAHSAMMFFVGLAPAVFAIQFTFPILLSRAGSIDDDGRIAAIGAPVIVSGFAWAAVLAGLIVRHGGIGALSLATDAGMIVCAGLLLMETHRMSPRRAAKGWMAA